jgi:benzoyl-CoA reductase/2-hydroxyglutaryl-CoA dehydratase subunit BcrC/BadD/HgdB
MADLESSRSILVKVFAEYYHAAARAHEEGKPIAYVTAFTPVEILRAMGVVCLYPESYAVVCAASNLSTDMIQASGMAPFSQDLCSYSLLSFGAEHYEKLPFRGLPQPDMLIATNNQCGTTVLWFRLLAQKRNIPLFIIDYPAAANGQAALISYVRRQYEGLVAFIEAHTGSTLDSATLSEQIERSRQTCALWKSVHEVNQAQPAHVDVQRIIDSLFPIVVAKGTQQAYDYYVALLRECSRPVGQDASNAVRLLWHGYPMWFLPKKFPPCGDAEFQIVLNDYTLWWSLRYPDAANDMEALAVAYSDTYLNRTLPQKVEEVASLAAAYSIDGVICHVNRSCRRALADVTPLRTRLHQLSIPSVAIESDMANPHFYSPEQTQLRIESFCDALRVL